MNMTIYRDENFITEYFGGGYCDEAADRVHMLRTHLHYALFNHPGLNKDEAMQLGEIDRLLGAIYQSVGARA